MSFVGGDGDGFQFWDRWFISLSLLKILGHLQGHLHFYYLLLRGTASTNPKTFQLFYYGSSKAKIIVDPFPPPTQHMSVGMKPASSHCEMPSVIRSGKLHKNAALGMLFSSLWQTDEPKGQNMVVHLSASDQESSWLVIENPHNCRGLAMYDKSFSINSGDASWDPSNLSYSFLLCIYCAALPPPPHGILRWLLMNQLWQTGIQKLDNDHTTHAHAHEKMFVQMRVNYDISPTSKYMKSPKNRTILGRFPFPSPRFGGKSFHLQRLKFSNLTPSTQVCSSMVGLMNWVKQGESRSNKRMASKIKLQSSPTNFPFRIVLSWYHKSLPDLTWAFICHYIRKIRRFQVLLGPQKKTTQTTF